MEVCIHVVNFSDCRLSILDWLERCRLPLVAWTHQESVGLYVSEFFPSHPVRKLTIMPMMEIHLDQLVLSVFFFFFPNLLSSHPSLQIAKKKNKTLKCWTITFIFSMTSKWSIQQFSTRSLISLICPVVWKLVTPADRCFFFFICCAPLMTALDITFKSHCHVMNG